MMSSKGKERKEEGKKRRIKEGTTDTRKACKYTRKEERIMKEKKQSHHVLVELTRHFHLVFHL